MAGFRVSTWGIKNPTPVALLFLALDEDSVGPALEALTPLREVAAG